MRPVEIAAAMARAPIAWIPLGALEYHADHLPNGTDGLTGHGLLVRAAQRVGGVVLPWSYVTVGTLALPWSFRYDPRLVAETLRQTLRQLPAHGVRLAVVHTGHGPLDLNHLIKRVCAEVAAEMDGFEAMGLCYLELNAALGTGLGTDWPVAVDHGATMETSWISALAPALVATDRLPDDPAASIVGVYGPNPRFTVDAATGAAQIDAAAALLADRAAAILRGDAFDPLADLRAFVERYWPERLLLSGRAGTTGAAVLELTNPGAVSRYLSGASLRLDGADVPVDGLVLVNPTAGETGVPFPVGELGSEHGFYVRRQQTAELRLPMAVGVGYHVVELTVELAGVTEDRLTETVQFS
ncbi:MAG: creatininase family protein [Candidatus Limnocylindrales bacterium]